MKKKFNFEVVERYCQISTMTWVHSHEDISWPKSNWEVDVADTGCEDNYVLSL